MGTDTGVALLLLAAALDEAPTRGLGVGISAGARDRAAAADDEEDDDADDDEEDDDTDDDGSGDEERALFGAAGVAAEVGGDDGFLDDDVNDDDREESGRDDCASNCGTIGSGTTGSISNGVAAEEEEEEERGVVEGAAPFRACFKSMSPLSLSVIVVGVDERAYATGERAEEPLLLLEEEAAKESTCDEVAGVFVNADGNDEGTGAAAGVATRLDLGVGVGVEEEEEDIGAGGVEEEEEEEVEDLADTGDKKGENEADDSVDGIRSSGTMGREAGGRARDADDALDVGERGFVDGTSALEHVRTISGDNVEEEDVPQAASNRSSVIGVEADRLDDDDDDDEEEEEEDGTGTDARAKDEEEEEEAGGGDVTGGAATARVEEEGVEDATRGDGAGEVVDDGKDVRGCGFERFVDEEDGSNWGTCGALDGFNTVADKIFAALSVPLRGEGFAALGFTDSKSMSYSFVTFDDALEVDFVVDSADETALGNITPRCEDTGEGSGLVTGDTKPEGEDALVIRSSDFEKAAVAVGVAVESVRDLLAVPGAPATAPEGRADGGGDSKSSSPYCSISSSISSEVPIVALLLAAKVDIRNR